MTKRIAKFTTVLAGCAALAVGGSAVAGAAQSHAPAAKSAATAERVGGPDTDNIQSGDQTTPDTAPVAAKSSAAEAPGTEQSPASEAAGEQPGSESAPGSDGPGGHADEPGNAAADHQFQGAE